MTGTRYIKARDKGSSGLGSPIPKPPETIGQEAAVISLFEFDLVRIDTLDKESKELLEIFALRYDDAEETDHQDILGREKRNTSFETLQILEQEKKEMEKQKALDRLTQVSSDEDFELFMEKLTKLEGDFLLGFKDLRRVKKEGINDLKARGVMMGVFMNSLNEKALDYLGDNLLEQEGDVLRLNEDFRQVLQRLAEEE